MAVWHVVNNETGVILGVYGEALLSYAQESARKIERETGCYVEIQSGVYADKDRPHVGQYITPRRRG